jgi:hypothetical protein
MDLHFTDVYIIYIKNVLKTQKFEASIIIHYIKYDKNTEFMLVWTLKKLKLSGEFSYLEFEISFPQNDIKYFNRMNKQRDVKLRLTLM